MLDTKEKVQEEETTSDVVLVKPAPDDNPCQCDGKVLEIVARTQRLGLNLAYYRDKQSCGHEGTVLDTCTVICGDPNTLPWRA